MSRHLVLAAFVVSVPASAQVPAPSLGTTEWRFTGATGEFVDATGGFAQMEYADGAGGQTSMLDTFTTTQAAGIPDIGGVDAPVMHFAPHVPNTTGYFFRPNVVAEPEQFTLVYDLFIPAGTTDPWMGLWNGNATNSNDAELHLDIANLGFWHQSWDGGSGPVGAGTWSLGEWFRLVYVNDHINDVVQCYVNGTIAFNDDSGDWLYGGISPGPTSWVLCDDNGDVCEGYIANLAYTEVLLDAATALALGSPSAEGVFSYSLGTNYCTSTPTSVGASSVIHGLGSASIADSLLTLSANNLPDGQPGIFIAGPSPAQVPFFNGFLCVSPTGLQRFVTVNAPTGNIVSEVVDFSSSTPGGLSVVPGQPYYFQRWNRDPAAGGGNANFSDGLEVQYLP